MKKNNLKDEITIVTGSGGNQTFYNFEHLDNHAMNTSNTEDYDHPDHIQLKVNNDISNEETDSLDPDDADDIELITDPEILEVESSNKVYTAYAGLTVISLPGYDNIRQPIVLHYPGMVIATITRVSKSVSWL